MMSFFLNFQSDKCPGAINGNALSGLNEKVCIQVERVFDACIKQNQLQNYSITLTDLIPSTPTFPLTFVSARSACSDGKITGLSVDRTAEKTCARVSGTVNIPLSVVYVDGAGVEGTASAVISLPFDVLMFVPSPSIMPFNVTAIVSAVAPDGTYVSGTTFTANFCTTLILKVSMPVELLVPTYGYCAIPPAQEYSQEVCAGFFELPLYPQGKTGGNCGCNKQ